MRIGLASCIRASAEAPRSRRGGPYRSREPHSGISILLSPGWKAVLVGGLSGTALGLGFTLLFSWTSQYGTALFFFTPFAIGAVSSAVYNRNARRSLGPTLGVALGALVLSGLLMLLFAIEGILCPARARPA